VTELPLLTVAVSLLAATGLTAVAAATCSICRRVRSAPRRFTPEREELPRESLTFAEDPAAGRADGSREHTRSLQEIHRDLITAGDQRSQAIAERVAKLIENNLRAQRTLVAGEKRPRRRSDDETKAPETVGTCSRNTFRIALAHRVAELTRSKAPLSVALLQIDGYEKLCETHGSHAGILVLQAASKYFSVGVRETDWVGRLDTTTFAILLPGAELHDAMGVAQRLREGFVQANLHVDNELLDVSVSTGVAEAIPGDDGDALLRRAGEALEAAVRLDGSPSPDLDYSTSVY
jgi:diguanylate cyclase